MIEDVLQSSLVFVLMLGLFLMPMSIGFLVREWKLRRDGFFETRRYKYTFERREKK